MKTHSAAASLRQQPHNHGGPRSRETAAVQEGAPAASTCTGRGGWGMRGGGVGGVCGSAMALHLQHGILQLSTLQHGWRSTEVVARLAVHAGVGLPWRGRWRRACTSVGAGSPPPPCSAGRAFAPSGRPWTSPPRAQGQCRPRPRSPSQSTVARGKYSQSLQVFVCYEVDTLKLGGQSSRHRNGSTGNQPASIWASHHMHGQPTWPRGNC